MDKFSLVEKFLLARHSREKEQGWQINLCCDGYIVWGGFLLMYTPNKPELPNVAS